MTESSCRGDNLPQIKIGTFDDSLEIDLFIDAIICNKVLQIALSQETREKALEIFGLFEKNETCEVDEEKFVNHWTGLQGRMSATDYFAIMDHDGSGVLTADKFLEFWRRVKE